MIYQYTSIKEVIGRVIRNTRLTDTSFISSMQEWIPEAMDFMRTKYSLVPKHKDVNVYYHVGELPKGLVSIEAIEYGGYRLNYSENLNTRHHRVSKIAPTIFQNIVVADDTDPDETIVFPTTVSAEQCRRLSAGGDSYHLEPGYIQTSFADGCIRIHYKSLPLDEEGFPLIPDNQDYKQALYWYTRSQMIGAGYEDTVFKFDYCMAMYNQHAARAIAAIRYPSEDVLRSRVQDITKFLPDNFTSYFGMGGRSNDLGFMSNTVIMPTSTAQVVSSRSGTSESIPSSGSTFPFEYKASGLEGKTIRFTYLVNTRILELFLDSYLLSMETSSSTPLTPNTFRFNATTGDVTFYNDFTPNQIIQGLYKTL